MRSAARRFSYEAESRFDKSKVPGLPKAARGRPSHAGDRVAPRRSRLAILPLVFGSIAVRFSAMSLAVLERIYRLPGPEQVRHLNAGVNAGVFGALAASIDVTANTLASALGLSPRTLRNRTKKPARLTADETERGFRVYRVLRRASDVLGNKEAAASWMNTPQKALGEQTPLSLLVRDVGTEEVLNVLTAIQYGVYL